jgi:hypothetical protein
MNWFGSAAILSSTIRTMRDKERRNRTTKCRNRHMQCSISGIEVVGNVAKKVSGSVQTHSAEGRRFNSKRWVRAEAISHITFIATYDQLNEIKKRWLCLWHRGCAPRNELDLGKQ